MKEENRVRNYAIIAAYATGGYSYKQLAGCFGVRFTTAGRIVRGMGMMCADVVCYFASPDPVDLTRGPDYVTFLRADLGQQ